MDAEFERRVTDVELFFRAINDTTTSPNEVDEHDCVTVLCECALVECTDVMRVPVEVYRDLHRRQSWFAIRPQHSLTGGSVVVEEQDEYWIVSRPELPQADDPTTSQPSPRAVSIDQMLLDALTAAIAERDQGAATAGFAVDRELMTLREQTEQSRISQRRYEFALDSYEQLMRHRIANPLSVICGVAQTLRDSVELGEVQQAELLDSLLEQANNLQSVVLEPRASAPTEFVLEPWPTAAPDDGTKARS